MVALPIFYAAKAVNPNSYSTESQGVNQDLIDEAVNDDSEDIIVYSGEETDAVINEYGTVLTEEDEFNLDEIQYNELREEATSLGETEQTVGTDNQHLYFGKKENYDAEIDEYLEEDTALEEFEKLVFEQDKGSEAGYNPQTALG